MHRRGFSFWWNPEHPHATGRMQTGTCGSGISFLRDWLCCWFRVVQKVELFFIFSGPSGSVWPLLSLLSSMSLWKWDSVVVESLAQSHIWNQSGCLGYQWLWIRGRSARPLSCRRHQRSLPLLSLPVLPTPSPDGTCLHSVRWFCLGAGALTREHWCHESFCFSAEERNREHQNHTLSPTVPFTGSSCFCFCRHLDNVSSD